MKRSIAAVAFILFFLPQAAPAADTFTVLPFQMSDAPSEESTLGKTISSFLSLVIARQTGWTAKNPGDMIWPATTWQEDENPPPDKMRDLSRSLGSTAVVTGSYRSQGGKLRIQADLYRPAKIGKEALRFRISGDTGNLPGMLIDLSTLIGEALEFRFLRRPRPPVTGSPGYLLSHGKPSFEARDRDEDTGQTETFLRSALKIDHSNADAQYQLGILLAQTGRLEEGLDHIKKAVDLRPQYSRYHYALGIGQYMDGRPDEALTGLLQATVIEEGFFDGFLALGRLHREMGDYDAARHSFQRAAELAPEDPAVSLAMGITAYLEREPAEARQHFESARASNPRLTAAYINLGVLELDEGNPEIAQREFAKALSSRFDSPEALNNMALLESRNGLTADSEEKFSTAVKGGSKQEQILTNLGALRMESGRWDEAASSFLAALEIAPSFAPALNNLGILLILDGKVDEGFSRFYAGLQHNPDDALLHYNLALTNHLTGADQQALVHYLKSVQGKRDFMEAHTNLGILFEEMNRPEKALTEYLKVLSSTQTHPEIYIYLGLNYSQRGYDTMAEETIRKATLVEVNMPAPYYHLALSEEKHDRAKAADTWKRFVAALERDPNRSFWVPFAEQKLGMLGSAP